jgi:hypothetical protein
MILAIRPDSWNFPLLLHVASAMLLVAAAVVVAVALTQALRTSEPDGAAALQRFGARTLLWVAVPMSILLNVDAEWIRSKEFPSGASDPAWIGWGYATAESSLIFLVIATILASLAVRRSRAGAGIGKLSKAATGLSLLSIAILLIATWAMTTKPS